MGVTMIVHAKDLRKKENLIKIPNQPGWYKWWAPKHSVNLILDSPHLREGYSKKLLDKLTYREFKGEIYYYLYVGIAVKESICDRFNWHINQKHNASCVKNSTLSTLRQSLSSILSLDQYDEVATNSFIDELIIEFEVVDYSIKSIEAKNIIEDIEKKEMNDNVLPLNIRDNHNKTCDAFKQELKRLRKIANK